MKIIVFGGAGFIGSALIKNLANKGHAVACADNLITGKRENLPSGIPFFNIDITDIAGFDRIEFDPDLIINLAFPTSLCDRKPENQFGEVTSTGMLNVLEYTRKTCNRIVYGSSISVYGEASRNPIIEESPVKPILIYGANKYLGELYTRAYHEQYGTLFNIIRISDTFGENDLRRNAINNFIKSLITGSEITITGDGEQLRTYTYVDDMAEAIALAVMKQNNEVYNAAANKAISINTLLEKLNSLAGMNKNALYRTEMKDSRNYVFDNSKFVNAFGEFEKTGLDEGLRRTMIFIRSTL
ncbi:MAG: NAD-dependent epimerase/dehydratase family protein [Methanosarcina sp.]